MAVPKFSKGRYFKRAHRQHSKDDDDDEKNKAAKEEKEKNRLLQQQLHQQEQQKHEEQREKMMLHAKKRIVRGLSMDMDLDLFDDDDNDNDEDIIDADDHDEFPKKKKKKKTLTFLERQVYHTNNGDLQPVSATQLEFGDILGQGAFATVRVVKSLSNDDGDDDSDGDSDSDCDDDDDDDNENNDANNDHGQQPSLVVKMLRPELLYTKNPRTIASIASDLVKEGVILANLANHPNILRLVGWTPTGLEGFFDVEDDNDDNGSDSERSRHTQQPVSSPLLRPDGFVLVLDRLSGSLTEKFIKWKHHDKQIKRQEHHHLAAVSFAHISRHLFHPTRNHPAAAAATEKNHSRDEFWMERLNVLQQLANGIAYLHSNRIIHRDLKPDNVGFDYRNPTVVKIFDFNVARKLPSSSKNEDELFRFTRNVGSRRYMAPEVGQKKLYNQQVDIYSFGLIAYQVLALPSSDKIFPDIYTIPQHETRVFVKGERPTLPTQSQSYSQSPHTTSYYWSTNLRQQIQRSWSTRIRDRPSATALKNFFTAEIAFHKESLLMSNNNNNNNKILVSSMRTPASKKSRKVSSSTRHCHHHHRHRRHSSRG